METFVGLTDALHVVAQYENQRCGRVVKKLITDL